MPLSVKRLLAQARGQGVAPEPQLIDGWMVEPVHKPTRNLWIWGAGHVGRALVDVLSPLPDLAITWVDTGPERFPDGARRRDKRTGGKTGRTGAPCPARCRASCADLFTQSGSGAVQPAAFARFPLCWPDRLGYEMGAIPVAAGGPRAFARADKPDHLPNRRSRHWANTRR